MLTVITVLLAIQLGFIVYIWWYLDGRDRCDPVPELNAEIKREATPRPCKYCGKVLDIGRHFVMYDSQMCEFERSEQLDKTGVEKVVAELLPGWQVERWLWCRRENKPYLYTATVRKYLRCGLREELSKAFGE